MMSREEALLLCRECRRLSRQSTHHASMGFFAAIVSFAGVLFFDQFWQMLVLLPMQFGLMLMSNRELRQAKEILDRLNADVLSDR
jgi:hypothetical protein